PQTMYAPDASVHVTEKVLANRLCGLRRPGHFRGVCTVVAKLFNLAQPQVAVFGQKDFQQACVIRRMVRDLNFPIRIVVAPIVREPDGLARSSRNTYLSEEERCRAVGLSQSLCLAKRLFREGQTSAKRIVSNMTKSLEKDGLQVDYVEIVDAETLDPVKTVQKGNALLLAVYDGKTRLIDNCLLS
ncbi:MAG: pantoate--beta-alanine ligase, partial [Kiritimatiellae bacterium]|nr:pantoate--beta-alanine ligase [Kiritimatiellia bacterium]